MIPSWPRFNFSKHFWRCSWKSVDKHLETTLSTRRMLMVKMAVVNTGLKSSRKQLYAVYLFWCKKTQAPFCLHVHCFSVSSFLLPYWVYSICLARMQNCIKVILRGPGVLFAQASTLLKQNPMHNTQITSPFHINFSWRIQLTSAKT